MQIQFEREKRNNYMVVACNGYLERNTYRTSVLEYAEITGFMNYEIREVDGNQILYYKLKYKTSLNHVLGEIKLTYYVVKNMIRSIADIMKQTEEYLLDSKCILWNCEYIFVDVSSGNLMFTYYPCEIEEKNSLKMFLMELISFVKKGERAYLLLIEFYNLVTNPECDLDEIIRYAHDEEERSASFLLSFDTVEEFSEKSCEKSEKPLEKVADVKERDNKGKRIVFLSILAATNIFIVCLLLFEIWTYQYIWVLMVSLILLLIVFFMDQPSEQNLTPDEIMNEYLQDCNKNTKEDLTDKMSYNENSEFAETTILMDETREVIMEDKPKEFCLISMNPKQYKNLIPDKNNIVIGSMKNTCDYVLSEKGISRMHAKILKKETGLYLLDLNSTNGTYLNEQSVVPGKEYQLEEGDVISIAKVATFAVTESVIRNKNFSQ